MTRVFALMFCFLGVFSASIAAAVDEPRPPGPTQPPEPTEPPPTPTPCTEVRVQIVEHAVAILRCKPPQDPFKTPVPEGEVSCSCGPNGTISCTVNPKGVAINGSVQVFECIRITEELKSCPWDGPTVENRCAGTLSLGDMKIKCACSGDDIDWGVGGPGWSFNWDPGNGAWDANCSAKVCDNMSIFGSACDTGGGVGFDIDFPDSCPLLGRPPIGSSFLNCGGYIGTDGWNCGGAIGINY